MNTTKHLKVRVVDGEKQIQESCVLELINQSDLILEPLKSDFRYALKQLRENPTSQFWARTAIRCLCAGIEAMLFTIRRATQLFAAVSEVHLRAYETAFLSGKMKSRPTFRDSVKETYRLYGKVIGISIIIDERAEGFNALCKTYWRRSKLIHPSKPLDLEVTKKDLDIARKGFDWLSEKLKSITDADETKKPEASKEETWKQAR